MVPSEKANAGPYLKRLAEDANPTFTTPAKRINDGDDLTFFFTSTAYRDFMIWILQLNHSMFPGRGPDGSIRVHALDTPQFYSSSVQSLRSLTFELQDLIQKAPPDTGPRRFGNVAFRTWFKLAEGSADSLLEKYLGDVLQKWGVQSSGKRADLKEELKTYLLGSFGSAQRLDYGTGHELSYLAFLGCLWKLGLFEDGEERAIVVGLIQPYITLIRMLVLNYTLEPAGSHGVWGLDDHCFIPYIFGSAQYGPAIAPSAPTPTEGSLPTAPSPSAVTDKRSVADYKDSNMYFSAIQFIYDVKRGPFWEHSPVLYDISGIKDGWGKINKGMLKMFVAEVLGKFPVVQHFPFGGLFTWEADPEAQRQQASSAHQQSQPPRSMDVPPAPAPSSGSSTKAPWARGAGGGGGMATVGATIPQMQSATGIATTRAPWAGNTSIRPHGNAKNSDFAPPAPSQQASSTSGLASTRAPWARQDGGPRRDP